MNIALDIILASWSVLTEMAPYLLLGFFFAGLLSVVISPAWVERHLGGRGMSQVFKASLFGVPLPLCSCGVLPVAASLRRQGASRGATTAFLLSTPQTGVDSIAVTYALLGRSLRWSDRSPRLSPGWSVEGSCTRSPNETAPRRMQLRPRQAARLKGAATTRRHTATAFSTRCATASSRCRRTSAVPC